jgi:hypothetical protein
MHGSPANKILLFTLLLGGACLACSRDEEPNLQDRYVRLFRPFRAEWQRESDVPSAPQRYPHMVIWEVSNYPPGSIPTPKQQHATDDLVERCRVAAVAHGWHDFEKGLADGFDSQDDERHYENQAFMLDDRILDCDRPEFLMYYPNPDGTKELVGFMFFARTTTERGPQIGGPLTIWHFHRWSNMQCTINGIIAVGWAVDGECEEGVGSHRSAEMLHVWLIDRPNGPISTAMHLEEHLELEGLDAILIPPAGDDLERFTAQLDAAIEDLDEKDRRLVSQSISYLTFAFGKGLTETGTKRREAGDITDPDTRGRMGLLRAARKRGSEMRLRQYVAIAFELDQLRPGIWTEYEEKHGTQGTQEASHH